MKWGIKFSISCHQITMRKVLMDCARRLSLYLTLSTDKASTRTQIKERYTGFDFKYEFGTNAL